MKGFTSIVSFPSVVAGNLSLFKKENDNNGSPNPEGRQFLGDDDFMKKGDNRNGRPARVRPTGLCELSLSNKRSS